MEQLPLPLKHALAYRAEGFFRHDGVRDLCFGLEAVLSRPGFQLTIVSGRRLSGKTHLAVWLSSILARLGSGVSWVDGRDLIERISQIEPRGPLLIDDGQIYFSQVSPGESGPFVRLVEDFRRSGQKIFLFNALEQKVFACDEHIQSRLNAAAGFTIGRPAEHDLETILLAMARQRGIDLPQTRLRFLLKRVGHSIEALDVLLDQVATILFAGHGNLAFESLERALDEAKNRVVTDN